MLRQHVMRLFESTDGLLVQVRWRDMSESEDRLELIASFFEEVSCLFHDVLHRKNVSIDLVSEARRAILLEEAD